MKSDGVRLIGEIVRLFIAEAIHRSGEHRTAQTTKKQRSNQQQQRHVNDGSGGEKRNSGDDHDDVDPGDAIVIASESQADDEAADKMKSSGKGKGKGKPALAATATASEHPGRSDDDLDDIVTVEDLTAIMPQLHMELS